MAASVRPAPVDDLPSHVRGALAGAFGGEQAATVVTGAQQMLSVSESLALHGALDLEDLRGRGLASAPANPATALLRAVPFGLLLSAERALLRRSAHRAVQLGGLDDGVAILGVAVALLVGDLCRYDLETTLVRVHQTLLEDAPTAVLRRLRPLPADAPLPDDVDPGDALQLAITALTWATGARTVVEELQRRRDGLGVALALAGALAGARDRERGMHEDWCDGLPQAGRLGTASSGLARRAVARQDAADPATDGGH